MKASDVEVVIPTRGRVAPVLAGLVPHAAECRGKPFSVRVITDAVLTEQWDGGALDILRHLGCRVVVELQRAKGHGPARAQGAFNTEAKVLLYMDDDCVLSPIGAVETIARAALNPKPPATWVTPIIRFVQNFTEAPRGHTEIWHPVSHMDPRVRRAIAERGAGWLRVFDVGKPVFTDEMGGACHAVRVDRMRAIAPKLAAWRADIGGADKYAGKLLGCGVTVPGTFAYHFGHYSPQKWNVDTLARGMLMAYPALAAKVADRRRK